MIEQHDAHMRYLRMIGGRPATPRPAVRPRQGEAPDGVAQYVCMQVIVPRDQTHQPHLCGKTVEVTPYAPIPYHCDMPMALSGYDWGRDVTP